MQPTHSSTLALDVGTVRIGVAIARADTKLAVPLLTLPNDDTFARELQKIIADETVIQLVIGLPRGMEGQDTAQTSYARDFGASLAAKVGLPVHFQDEALTSQKAEQELQTRGKAYTKEDIDALSATYILEDFLQGATPS